MTVITWDGIGFTWDGIGLTWVDVEPGTPAPAFPADLYGAAAPQMLAYLAYYWWPNIHLRAILQSEGYEFDYIRSFIYSAADAPLPGNIPSWAIPIWEATLELPTSTGWTTNERRRRVSAVLSPAQNAAQIAELLGSHLRMDAADITVGHTAFAMDVAVDAALSPGQTLLATQVLTAVLPAHMTLNLTSL